MPRPSRHLDRALLAAGRALLPLHGLSGLTIRQVPNLAAVNIGMFHYHFRTREAFLRAVLQEAYEEMFSQLTLGAAGEAGRAITLRAALRVIGRFLLSNRALLARVLADALAGDAIARDFLRDNFPRHLRVVVGLVAAGQAYIFQAPWLVVFPGLAIFLTSLSMNLVGDWARHLFELVDGSERLSLGILTLDASGRGELTFTDERGSNLIENYSGVEVTIEPSQDTDPETSGIVAYSFYHGQDGLTHLRYLLASYTVTPGENALIQGLHTDIQTIGELGQEMQKASTNGNSDRVMLNAEAILNILVGDESNDHKDWNADGQVDDPSDGYGLLFNGRNQGYLNAVYTEADAAVKASGGSQQMVTSGEGVKSMV